MFPVGCKSERTFDSEKRYVSLSTSSLISKSQCHEKFYYPPCLPPTNHSYRVAYYRGHYSGWIGVMVNLAKSIGEKAFRFSTVIQEAEMEVVFGTPSRNCEGSGICMVTGRFPPGYTIVCPHARAIIYCDMNEKELVFRFPKRYLSDDIVKRFFSKDFFTVEEPFRLPIQLVRRWRLPGRYVAAGYYPIEIYSTEWRLYFPWPRD